MAKNQPILEHFQKRLYASVTRSPLLRVRTSRTGRLIDLSRLDSVDSELPRGILDSVIKGTSAININLRLRDRLSAEALKGLFDEPEQRPSRHEREQMLLYGLLQNMRRHGELAKRETGVHALWLGYPLIYVSVDVEEEHPSILAPVFVWPVSVEPDLQHEGRFLVGRTGTARFNMAMATWARKQLNIVLPTPDEEQLMDLDWDGLKACIQRLVGSFQEPPLVNLEAQLQPVPAYKELEGEQSPQLFNSAFIGYCRWQHEAILADLASMAEKDQCPDVAGSFITGARLRESLPNKPPPEEDRYIVCEADFSQEEVIWQARQGPAMVVHGPPGTGKSQTIVNIIADALAHGRKVLMVCQKQAATRVVLERLRAVGLADLCLEVHDVETDRLTVFNAIRTQVDNLPRFVSAGGNNERASLARQIADLETILDSYAKALHSRHPVMGVSYRQMKALEGKTYAEFPTARALPALQQALSDTSAQDLEALCRRIEGVGCLFRKADALRNPWRFRQPSVQMSISLRSDVAPILEKLRSLDSQHQEQIHRNGPGMRLPQDVAGFSEIAPGLSARLRMFLERYDSSFGKTLRSSLRFLGSANSDERDAMLNKCRTAVALAQEVERTPLDPIWTERCREITYFEIYLLRERAEKVRAWQNRLVRFFIPSYLTAVRKIRELRPDAKGHALGPVCETALKHLHARDLRHRLTEANNSLLSGLKPGSEQERVQIRFAKVALEGLETAIWLHEHAMKLPWLKTLPNLIIRGDTAPLMQFLHSVESALLRVPATQDVLRGMEDLASLLRPEGLSEPRDLVLAGASIADWLDAFEGGLCNLEALIGLESDRQQREGLVEVVLEALEKYETDRLRGQPGPQSPAHLSATDYGQWWVALVRYSAAQAWQQRAQQENPELMTITPAQHSAKVEQLRFLLKKKRQMEPVEIKARWREKQIPLRKVQWKRMLQLRRSKLGDAKRLREAIELSLPEGLLVMRPCWLVNPGAAAQLFPLEPGLFDVVIFDEASQCPIEQALPAIYRANTLIVSGDGMQLPPTSFFSAKWDEEDSVKDDDEEASSDPIRAHTAKMKRLGQDDLMRTEDLLQAAINGNLSERYLKVHYRSMHPALINFSNQAFYGGRLEAPPSRVGFHAVSRPICYHQVDGLYAERTNAKEADKVVNILQELWLSTGSCPTIGVVTFNQPQRDLIEDYIAKECLRDPAFAVRYQQELERKDDNRDVGFFVKNLENVQGDERDLIMFSTTFGRDSTGTFYRRFGPVGAQDGHRRLNVAVTRAKQQVIVIGSMPVDEISTALQEGASPGRARIPADYLQFYLAYAQAVSASDQERVDIILGMLTRQQGREVCVGTPESPFEEDVYQALRGMGHQVHCQVGDSGFRIDLAVLHPGHKRGYILGIECDGATYHSDRSARIRDVWREQILKDRGWCLHRVWSTRWWYHKDEEIRLLKSAITRALNA